MLQAKLPHAERRAALAALQSEYSERREEFLSRRRELLNRIKGNLWFGERRLLEAFPSARYARGGEDTPLAELREELFRTRLELKVANAALDEMRTELADMARELQAAKDELAAQKQ